MKDIIERLRDNEMYVDACDEAARLIEQQRAELAALRAERDEYRNAIEQALRQLRGTQLNWHEDCLFNANDILEDALKGTE